MTEREADQFIPDVQVRREFGVSDMSLYRWTRDPKLCFPPPIKINGRNYRSRKALEAYKARLIREATLRAAS